MAIETVAAALITSLAGSTGSALYELIKQAISDKLDPEDLKQLEEEDPTQVTPREARGLQAAMLKFENSSGIVEATKSTSSAISAAMTLVQGLREDRRKQAKWSFVASLVLAIIGVIIIFVGVVLLIAGDDAIAGGVTTGAGVVSEIVAGLLYKLYRDTNDRFDEMLRDAQVLESTQIGIETAAKIEDATLRDQTLSELAKRINSHK